MSDLSICFDFPEFECEEGWHSIVNSVLLCIDRHLRFSPQRSPDNRFSISQIKQKMGGLRIYCVNSNSYIDGVIDLAETMAYNTCEITGNPGSLHQKDYLVKVLSPQMAEQMGFSPSGKDHRTIHASKKKSSTT